MFKWSRRSRQTFRGRGNIGAHKLIPISLRISRAPALQRLKPQASSRSKPLLYRTINDLGPLAWNSIQMHTTTCPTTNKTTLILVRAGRCTFDPRRTPPRLTVCTAQADTASHGKIFRGPDAAISHDHGSLCLAEANEESQS